MESFIISKVLYYIESFTTSEVSLHLTKSKNTSIVVVAEIFPACYIEHFFFVPTVWNCAASSSLSNGATVKFSS